MTNQETIAAKATTLAEQSDSIVVSFGADWQQHLLAKDFSVVIRKRVPKNNSFKWLYFHINSPISKICGRAEIEKIFTLSSRDAVVLAKQINLSAAEILDYIGENGFIGCYKLGAVQIAVEPVSSAQLAARLVYHPPQSFFIVSKQAKQIIDHLAGFNPPKQARRLKAGNS